MSNKSISYFLLITFSDLPETLYLYFMMFFLIYFLALVGNLLIITTVVLSVNLHTPMYFFLINLSIVDLGYISVTIPKAMVNAIKKTRMILYSHCVAQVFSLILFGASEFFLLTVMAYDRYVAICHPLHYETIMSRVRCIQMACFVWTMGLLTAALHTGATFARHFCSNIIDQFFCEIPQMLKNACSDMYLMEVGALFLSGCFCFLCFLFIFVSYVHIFKAVIRIPSDQGRQKAFSTCLPHLIVLSMFYFFGVFAYLRPFNRTSSQMDLVAAIAYCVVPPFMNPVIYSMRNREIKRGLYKLMYGKFSGKNLSVSFTNSCLQALGFVKLQFLKNVCN